MCHEGPLPLPFVARDFAGQVTALFSTTDAGHEEELSGGDPDSAALVGL